MRISTKTAMFIAAAGVFATPMVLAHGDADPLLGKLTLENLEYRKHDRHSGAAVAGDAWLGYDLHKLWFKIEIERADGDTEEAELQVLYNRAVSANWDLQLGLRHDFEPAPETTWAVLGLQGLAPYFVDVEAHLFLGENGRTAARINADHDLLLSQRWILTPTLELNLFGQNDREQARGSGLSDAEVGLRLRYEITPQFAPYVGVIWSRAYGKTASYHKALGEDTEKNAWVAGLRLWF